VKTFGTHACGVARPARDGNPRAGTDSIPGMATLIQTL
jgi:hypothetical protein